VPCASGPTLNGRLRTSAKAREPAGPSGSVKGLSARPGRHGPDSESELPSAGDPRRPRPVCTPGKAGCTWYRRCPGLCRRWQRAGRSAGAEAKARCGVT
jgi:hypothetical protein